MKYYCSIFEFRLKIKLFFLNFKIIKCLRLAGNKPKKITLRLNYIQIEQKYSLIRLKAKSSLPLRILQFSILQSPLVLKSSEILLSSYQDARVNYDDF